MADFLLRAFEETWIVLKQASLFVLRGFMRAGVFAALVPNQAMRRFFGTARVKSVLWASAIGTPLHLCSCRVLPAALGLKRQGATRRRALMEASRSVKL